MKCSVLLGYRNKVNKKRSMKYTLIGVYFIFINAVRIMIQKS